MTCSEMNDTRAVIDGIGTHLRKKITPGSSIVAVYLFGSYAREQVREDSDIDIAFLLNEKDYKSDPFEASSLGHVLATDIGMSFGKSTDVTILNSSSVEMAYEIVTTGICLYEQDHDRRLEYEAVVRGLYFDFRPFIERLRSNCLERL